MYFSELATDPAQGPRRPRKREQGGVVGVRGTCCGCTCPERRTGNNVGHGAGVPVG